LEVLKKRKQSTNKADRNYQVYSSQSLHQTANHRNFLRNNVLEARPSSQLERTPKSNYFDDPEYWMHRGTQLKQANNIEKAIKSYKRGLYSNQVSVNFALATAYMIKKDYEQSIGYFLNILEVNPQHTQTIFGLSLSLFKLEKYKEALTNITKAIELLAPTDEIYSYVCVRGLCYKELNNLEKATEDFDYLRSFDTPKTLLDINNENSTKTEVICIRHEDTPHILLSQEFYIEGEGWIHDKLDKASRVIKRVAFFKRFSDIHLKAYIGYMSIKTYQANQLVIVPKNHACIVMGGTLIMKKF
jgi:tetratricopeptide (TPR) repeat protein